MTEVADNTLVDSRYLILRRIGSGGMADVYCAEDTHLGRQVALKVLHRRFAQDAQFVERFRREASAAVRRHAENAPASGDERPIPLPPRPCVKRDQVRRRLRHPRTRRGVAA